MNNDKSTTSNAASDKKFDKIYDLFVSMFILSEIEINSLMTKHVIYESGICFYIKNDKCKYDSLITVDE